MLMSHMTFTQTPWDIRMNPEPTVGLVFPVQVMKLEYEIMELCQNLIEIR